MADDKTTKTPEQPVTDTGPGKETPPMRSCPATAARKPVSLPDMRICPVLFAI